MHFRKLYKKQTEQAFWHEQNMLYGSDIETQTIVRAKYVRLGWMFNGISAIISFLMCYGSFEYSISVFILALMPLSILFIVFSSKRKFKLYPPQHVKEPNLFVGYVAPIVAQVFLLGGISNDLSVVWVVIIASSTFCGLFYVFSGYEANSINLVGDYIIIGLYVSVLTGFYLMPNFLAFNIALGSSSQTNHYKVKITEKEYVFESRHTVRHRYRSGRSRFRLRLFNRYRFRLENWKFSGDISSLSPSKEDFYSAHAGSQVEISEKKGAFGISYFTWSLITEGIEVFGILKDETTGEPIEKGIVRVTINGFETLDEVSRHGEFGVSLPYGLVSRFEFSATNFVSKIVEVNTMNVPEERKEGGFGIDLDISLPTRIKGIDYSFLDEPIGKAIYNPNEDLFSFENEYTFSQVAKYNALMKRVSKN